MARYHQYYSVMEFKQENETWYINREQIVFVIIGPGWCIGCGREESFINDLGFEKEILRGWLKKLSSDLFWDIVSLSVGDIQVARASIHGLWWALSIPKDLILHVQRRVHSMQGLARSTRRRNRQGRRGLWRCWVFFWFGTIDFVAPVFGLCHRKCRAGCVSKANRSIARHVHRQPAKRQWV